MPKLPPLVFAPSASAWAYEAPAASLRRAPGEDIGDDAAPLTPHVDAFLCAPHAPRGAELGGPAAPRPRTRRAHSVGPASPPRIDVARRQQSLAAWQLEGLHGVRVRVLDLAETLREGLHAQGFHTVHIAACGIAGLGATDLGADIVDCEGAHLVVQALSTEPGADARSCLSPWIGRCLQDALARQAPRGGFWVETKSGPDAAQVAVKVLGQGPSQVSLTLWVARPDANARPYTFLEQAAAIPLRAPEQTRLWPCDAAADPFDDVRRGVYRLDKSPHWTALAQSWHRRVQGSVPANPKTEAALWAPLWVHGQHGVLLPLSVLVRDVMTHPQPHRAALVLANACASADAVALGAVAPNISAMLGGALAICAACLGQSTHRPLIDAFASAETRAAMALYAWAFSLPTPLARQPNHPSIEFAQTESGQAVQLRLRLGSGAFWTPSFARTGPAAPLPALSLPGDERTGARTPAREIAWLIGTEALAGALFDAAPPAEASAPYCLDPDALIGAQPGLHRLAAKRLWQHAARAAAISPADGIRVALAAVFADPTCGLECMPEVCRAPHTVLLPRVWQALTGRLEAHWDAAVAAMHTMTPHTAVFDWARLAALADARTWLLGSDAAWPQTGLRQALAVRAWGPHGGVVPFADEMHRLVDVLVAPVELAPDQVQIGEVYEWVAIWLRLKRFETRQPALIARLEAALHHSGEHGLNAVLGALVRCHHEQGLLEDAWLMWDLLSAPLSSLSDEAIEAWLACRPAHPSLADQAKIRRLQRERTQRAWHIA